ncbi:hypothetical protein [Streptomyces sp. NPDC001833]|uniref:hypothetical protein n=1 Tax=Streptomyces sp. NPDC001833 TaxID=3154658 RepID=UPI0033324E42
MALMQGSAAIAQKEVEAWNSILPVTTPNGKLVAKDSPHRAVAELAADVSKAQRRIEPSLVPKEIITSQDVAHLARMAEVAIAENGRPLLGHKVADVPAEVIRAMEAHAIVEWCKSLVPSIKKIGDMAFIYYDKEGEDSKLHLDSNENWSYNALICLNHTMPTHSVGSATYFMLGGGVTRAHRLGAGNGIFFHSRHTPHGRTPIGDGEKVLLASIGFRA